MPEEQEVITVPPKAPEDKVKEGNRDKFIGYWIYVTNTEGSKAKVTIIKKASDTNETLAGAKFYLAFKENGKFVRKTETKTTDESGIVEFYVSEPGTYYVYETEAPDDYYIINSQNGEKSVTINNNDITEGKTFEPITIYNDPNIKYLTILKRDEDGSRPIPNTTFLIRLDWTSSSKIPVERDYWKGKYYDTKFGYPVYNNHQYNYTETFVSAVNINEKRNQLISEIESGKTNRRHTDDFVSKIYEPLTDGYKFSGNEYYESWWYNKNAYVDYYRFIVATTDNNGKIELTNSEMQKDATYTIEEVIPNGEYYNDFDTVDNDGYLNGDVIVWDPTSNNEEITINDPRRDIDLIGYIWLDGIEGKTSKMDNLCTSNDEIIDPKDINIKLYKDDQLVEEIVEGKRKIIKPNHKSNRDRLEGIFAETERKPIITVDGKLQYCFENLDYQNIDQYEVKFEYNGLKYEAVDVNADKENGSKVKEEGRNIFNYNFSTIDGQGAVNCDKSIDYDSENHKSTIKYGGRSEYVADEKYNIKATTDGTYNFSKDISEDILTKESSTISVQSIKEIENVNLGLKVRAQPDIAVVKDLENVIIDVNGKTNTYEYMQNYDNSNIDDGKNDELSKIGVKTLDKYDKSYYRKMYRTDITNKDIGDYIDNGELVMTANYIIRVENQSSLLTSYVNAITEQWSNEFNYEITLTTPNGSEYNTDDREQHETFGEDKEQYYKKTFEFEDNDIIEIGPGKSAEIKVACTLTRETINDMLNDILSREEKNKLNELETLYNLAEISEYTTRSGGKAYAGVDQDSRPDSADLYDKDTFEDDSDRAPGFIIEEDGDPDSRKIEGVVFEDIPKDVQKGIVTPGAYREGNEQYDTDEKTIKDVEVKLIYAGTFKATSENNVSYTVVENTSHRYDNEKTGDDGSYSFKGVLPGNYQVLFIWGANSSSQNTEHYYVEDYKSTTMKKTRYDNNSEDVKWWWYDKNADNDRYSDALDDYNIRTDIDSNLKKFTVKNYIDGNYDTDGNYSNGKFGYDEDLQMHSITQSMEITIESGTDSREVKSGNYDNEKNIEYNLVNKLNELGSTYNIHQMDFGIIERPRQEVALDKRISHIKLFLANGQVLIDNNIVENEDGEYEFEGEIKNAKYLNPKVEGNTLIDQGKIDIELDKEIIQGATVETTYEFVVYNNSEQDFANDQYYHYGQSGDSWDENPVKMKVTVADYLDNVVTRKKQEDKVNEGWRDDLAIKNEKYLVDQENEEKYFNSEYWNNNKKSPPNGTFNKYNSNYFNWIDVFVADGKDGKGIEAKGQHTFTYVTTKVLSNQDEITFDNMSEVIKIDTPNPGSPPKQIPGNYMFTLSPNEPDSSISEEVIITNPTGSSEEFNTTLYIIIGAVALLVTGIGIVIIKKKVLS